jgi:hypothetical protein
MVAFTDTAVVADVDGAIADAAVTDIVVVEAATTASSLVAVSVAAAEAAMTTSTTVLRTLDTAVVSDVAVDLIPIQEAITDMDSHTASLFVPDSGVAEDRILTLEVIMEAHIRAAIRFAMLWDVTGELVLPVRRRGEVSEGADEIDEWCEVAGR